MFYFQNQYKRSYKYMVTKALLARCCNWRITSTSKLCYQWESDKLCRLWMKKFLKIIFFLECHYPHRWTVSVASAIARPHFYRLIRMRPPAGHVHTKQREHEGWLQCCHNNKTQAWKFPGCHECWSNSPQLCISSHVEIHTLISSPSGCAIFLYLLLHSTPKKNSQKSWPFSGSYKFRRRESCT
jgi:hypothetical protein